MTSDAAEKQGFTDKSIKYYEKFYDEFYNDCDFLVSEINFNKSIAKLEKLLESIEDSSKNKQRIQSLEKEIGELKILRDESSSSTIQLANMILVYSKDQAIYFLGGSSSKYQKLPGAFMLQYQAMKKTKEKNIPLYNFFGIEGNFDPKDGVLRFKQNFNGYIIRKVGAFIYYPKPIKYRIIQMIKSIKEKIIKS